MVLGTRFEIDKRYEIIDPIGSGAYGVVVAAKDTSIPESEEQ
jgi:serine/threonine protein kinase